jgi:hypothetical protein
MNAKFDRNVLNVMNRHVLSYLLMNVEFLLLFAYLGSLYMT